MILEQIASDTKIRNRKERFHFPRFEDRRLRWIQRLDFHWNSALEIQASITSVR